jgi:hypothetical protein
MASKTRAFLKNENRDFNNVLDSMLNLADSSAQTVTSAVEVAGASSIATTAQMTAGTGITSATGEVYLASVVTVGNIIYTDILIDLTGLNDGGTAGDIIGKDGGTANCHIGQITAAVNGTIFGGSVTCLEVPAGGDVDVDLWYADNATGVQDAAVTTLTNQVQVTNNGDHTIGRVTPFLNTVFPPADKYLYLANGAVTAADYTAGRFLIRMYGYSA